MLAFRSILPCIALLFAATALAKAPRTLVMDDLEDWLIEHVTDTSERLDAAEEGTVNRRAKKDVQWFSTRKHYLFKSEMDRKVEIERLKKELVSPTLPPLNLQKVEKWQIGSLPLGEDGYHIHKMPEDRLDAFLIWLQPPEDQKTAPWIMFYLQRPKTKNWKEFRKSLINASRYNQYPKNYVVIGEQAFIGGANATWPKKLRQDIHDGKRPILPVIQEYDISSSDRQLLMEVKK